MKEIEIIYRESFLKLVIKQFLFFGGGLLIIFNIYTDSNSYGYSQVVLWLIYFALFMAAIGSFAVAYRFTLILINRTNKINNRIVFLKEKLIVPGNGFSMKEREIPVHMINKIIDLKMNRFRSDLTIYFKNGSSCFISSMISREKYNEIRDIFEKDFNDKFERQNLNRWPQ